jgi:excisionase family DNA binding protein
MTKQRFITLSELCDQLGIGKQTYYKLVRRGLFPAPMRAGTRPVFDQDLTQQCIDVVRTRVGINGEPVLLNRRSGPASAPKKKVAPKHEDLIAALASLGVQTTPAKVQAVLETLPTDLPEPELIKAVFRELKKQA